MSAPRPSAPKQNSRIVKKSATFLGGALIAAAFIGGFIAYFVFSFDPKTHLTYDGFGRALSDTPFVVRFIFGQDRLWAGWGWFAGDMMIFWGAIAIGAALINYGSKK